MMFTWPLVILEFVFLTGMCVLVVTCILDYCFAKGTSRDTDKQQKSDPVAPRGPSYLSTFTFELVHSSAAGGGFNREMVTSTGYTIEQAILKRHDRTGGKCLILYKDRFFLSKTDESSAIMVSEITNRVFNKYSKAGE